MMISGGYFMKYGYFDEGKKEYVITRPDTPAPWANYLGSPAYGAIISNNAGGYSFVQSGANGRIIRYHFNSDSYTALSPAEKQQKTTSRSGWVASTAFTSRTAISAASRMG